MRRWGALALAAAVMLALALAVCRQPRPAVLPAPAAEQIARYLQVLPEVFPAGRPAPLVEPRRAVLIAAAGFADEHEFARVQSAVLGGYACLQAERLRAELSGQLEDAPPGLALPLRQSIVQLDARIQDLRRQIAPETLPRLAPFLPELDRLLGAQAPTGIGE